MAHVEKHIDQLSQAALILLYAAVSWETMQAFEALLNVPQEEYLPKLLAILGMDLITLLSLPSFMNLIDRARNRD